MHMHVLRDIETVPYESWQVVDRYYQEDLTSFLDSQHGHKYVHMHVLHAQYYINLCLGSPKLSS